MWTFIKYKHSYKPIQQAHHGQMTSKQRYINVDSVETTLFRRRLTMMFPLGQVVYGYGIYIYTYTVLKLTTYIYTSLEKGLSWIETIQI